MEDFCHVKAPYFSKMNVFCKIINGAALFFIFLNEYLCKIINGASQLF